MTETQDDAPEPTPATRGPSRRVVALGALGVVAAVLALAAVAVRGAEGSPVAEPPGTTAAQSSSRPPSPTRSAAAPETQASPTVRPVEDPRDRAELEQVAAQLRAGLALGSPPGWDQWLPEGKPYPGVDLQDDLSTCPVLSSRLEAVVGQEMSYWTGTLPNQFGCTWVETPLSGQDNVYDYFISVGFLADGTTVDEFRLLREGPGQGTHPCPAMDVPAVAEGSLLVRCASSGSTVYTLVAPDTRLDGGLWLLTATSKDSTPVRPAEILPVLVDGAVAAFG